jgi:hypothetical protein
MQPRIHTPAELRGVLEELRAREPIFHRPEFGNARADLERLMHESYWEVGASGTRYSREFVLETLLTRAPDPAESSWVVREFQVSEIAADNYLATYTLFQGTRVSRRATLWRRGASGWQILYHQGTLAPAQT